MAAFFPCAGYSALAETMPPMRAKWVTTQTANPRFFFTKPADALVLPGQNTPYPSETANLHHEIELVVAIGKGGQRIETGKALSHVFGYSIGVDLTRRDMQDEAKTLRRPWDLSKGFDASAPIGGIVPASVIGHPASGRIALRVNGKLRQEGDLADQIWQVPEIIAALSRFVALAPGDLIMTGTPEGVNAVVKGDLMEGEISGVGTLRTKVV